MAHLPVQTKTINTQGNQGRAKVLAATFGQPSKQTPLSSHVSDRVSARAGHHAATFKAAALVLEAQATPFHRLR